MSVLADRLLAIHGTLAQARIPHAFGGAIALAYCTEEPRGTRDIDINVFLDVVDVERVMIALPSEVAYDDAKVNAIRRDGQSRLWWDDTPVDLFFDVHEFHRRAALNVRIVPFAGSEIPVLDCGDLVVFKSMFNRTQDWADIEKMIAAGTFDVTVAIGWVTRLLGPDHPATQRLADLVR